MSTWESVARRGVCGARADIGGAGRAAGDAGKVATTVADEDEEVRKIGVGVASCGRGEILEEAEEDFASTTIGEENGMHSVPCHGSLMIVSTLH